MEEFKIKGSLDFDTTKATDNLNSFIKEANQPLFAGNNEIPTMAQMETETFNDFNNSFTNLEESFRGILNSIKSLSGEINKLDYINEGNVKEVKTIPSNNNQPEIDITAEKFENLNDVTTKVKDVFKDVLINLKDFSKQLDDSKSNKNLPVSSSGTSLTLKEKSEIQSWQKGVREVPSIVNTGANIVGSLARQDIAGAAITGVNTVAQSGMQAGSSLMNSGLGTLGKGLLIGGGAAAIIGGLMKGANYTATEYEDALPELDSLNKTFGGDRINGLSATENAKNSLALRKKASLAAEGTGLTNEEFVRLSTSLGQYGVTNQERANDIAQQAANWSRYTNADANQVANFAGLMERYGGNGTQMVQTAYGAARASGLDRNQFGEFLSGLQTVVETGISKGFVRSADDVSESLANISLLSGNNPLWSGKQGAERYNQMSSAMSNATSLNSTSSQLIYQAMADSMGGNASWLEVMSKIEQGDWGNSEFIESYKKALNGAYSNDKYSQIASIKESFGLNWTGAQDVYKMIFEGVDKDGEKLTSEQIDEKIKAYQTDPKTASDATNMQEALNRLNTAITEMGRKPFELKYQGIDEISKDVKTIAEKLNIKIDLGETKKTEHDNAKVNNTNYNDIIGKSYTYTITDPKNDFKTETYQTTDINEAAKYGAGDSETQITLKDLRDEAYRSVTTPGEIAAYTIAQGLAESDVGSEVFKQFLSEMAKAQTKKTLTEGRLFSKDDIHDIVDAFKPLLKVKVVLPEGY